MSHVTYHLAHCPAASTLVASNRQDSYHSLSCRHPQTTTICSCHSNLMQMSRIPCNRRNRLNNKLLWANVHILTVRTRKYPMQCNLHARAHVCAKIKTNSLHYCNNFNWSKSGTTKTRCASQWSCRWATTKLASGIGTTVRSLVSLPSELLKLRQNAKSDNFHLLNY